MAPSSSIEHDDIERSKSALVALGKEIFIHPQTFAKHHQSAGLTAEKLEALHGLYADKTIDAIWAAGGGNRAMDMLSGLDFDLIKDNPKPLIGYSDVSCLLNAVAARTGQICYHAPMFKELHKTEILKSPKNWPLGDDAILNGGRAEGVSVGGCLSLFHLLVGTDKCPKLEGAILFLEDTGDQISRFDRMFLDMKHKGVFEKIGGLVLGGFHDLQDGARPFGFTMEEIVRQAVGEQDIPVIMNAPFGHGEQNSPFPIGGHARLNSSAQMIEFNLCSSAVE